MSLAWQKILNTTTHLSVGQGEKSQSQALVGSKMLQICGCEPNSMPLAVISVFL